MLKKEKQRNHDKRKREEKRCSFEKEKIFIGKPHYQTY